MLIRVASSNLGFYLSLPSSLLDLQHPTHFFLPTPCPIRPLSLCARFCDRRLPLVRRVPSHLRSTTFLTISASACIYTHFNHRHAPNTTVAIVSFLSIPLHRPALWLASVFHLGRPRLHRRWIHLAPRPHFSFRILSPLLRPRGPVPSVTSLQRQELGPHPVVPLVPLHH